ncbi:aminotransferase-like domain-containing protein [Planosporangium mesophilum]|uniref:GntR family transcriptional regulator n=1 Tax=Planosporangium mesophilum TaxID=689768 RepID=A0A8J3X315_9ACTN|nr:PLP-dependent aminotransferase family protein [Planosporangium mesophilum]NJC82642.1 PLP-dependent aminotransferase family protein [Planosporangium mesophilum]GII25009.1 GntR family transcriptional regulator [Planosporangium mesophilum]
MAQSSTPGVGAAGSGGWHPRLAADRPAYQALADAIGADVAHGRLNPGDRLPTHRALARTLGVTVGTVARGYAEAERRGLLGGEVGRGTFIRSGFGVSPAGDGGLVDLSQLHPPIRRIDTTDLLADTLNAIAADPSALRTVIDTERGEDARAHRRAAADWLAHGAFQPDADQVTLTAGAQHALTAALSALVEPGTAVATTGLTNPGLLAAARQLRLPVVAVASDDEGMTPEALAEACRKGEARREGRISVVHLQSTLDNPTGRVMPAARRAALAEVCDRHGVWVIEDDPLGVLVPDRPDPMAALLPARTCHLASAAKVLSLGLRVGVLTAPPDARARLVAAVRATAWLAAPLLGEVFARWVTDGTAGRVVAARVAAATARQALAAELLGRYAVPASPRAPHLWLALPEPWTAGQLVAAARQNGVLLSPGDDYAASRATPAHGVRIGLNADVDDDLLRAALLSVVALLAAGPLPGGLS